ncbi:terminase gpP N-terminus-related DNA-binding protein [Bacillus toyonensis]|nr:hypothetical protein CN579_32945 [Bacillus toyonensis]
MYETKYLSLQNYSKPEIANIVGCSETTIYNYVKAYKERKIDGLMLGCST